MFETILDNFHFNSFNTLISALIAYLGLITLGYSRNYMRGDLLYNRFIVLLSILIVSLILTFLSNNIIFFTIGWTLNNILLAILMIHKSSWKQAKTSGILALKYLLLSSIFLAYGFAIIADISGSIYFSEIITHSYEKNSIFYLAILFILIAVIAQSALFPFHKWLLSSLNSPTPVSAIMHAGIVNGGGVLLIKLFPIFSSDARIMLAIFLIGFTSAFWGTILKLVQNNNKNMLACSTMSQMGCMIMEIGLGFQTAATAHIILHSLFKSYLFFNSGSAYSEKKLEVQPSSLNIISSFIIAIPASLIFSKISKIDISFTNTRIMLIFMAYIAYARFASIILAKKNINFIVKIFVSMIPAMVYGINIMVIDNLLKSHRDIPQDISIMHIIPILMVLVVYIGFNYQLFKEQKFYISLKRYFYVKILNAGFSAKQTITANKNNYNWQ